MEDKTNSELANARSIIDSPVSKDENENDRALANDEACEYSVSERLALQQNIASSNCLSAHPVDENLAPGTDVNAGILVDKNLGDFVFGTRNDSIPQSSKSVGSTKQLYQTLDLDSKPQQISTLLTENEFGASNPLYQIIADPVIVHSNQSPVPFRLHQQVSHDDNSAIPQKHPPLEEMGPPFSHSVSKSKEGEDLQSFEASADKVNGPQFIHSNRSLVPPVSENENICSMIPSNLSSNNVEQSSYTASAPNIIPSNALTRSAADVREPAVMQKSSSSLIANKVEGCPVLEVKILSTAVVSPVDVETKPQEENNIPDASKDAENLASPSELKSGPSFSGGKSPDETRLKRSEPHKPANVPNLLHEEEEKERAIAYILRTMEEPKSVENLFQYLSLKFQQSSYNPFFLK
jgi:hypothetical protein